jgi:hypothetical protein
MLSNNRREPRAAWLPVLFPPHSLCLHASRQAFNGHGAAVGDLHADARTGEQRYTDEGRAVNSQHDALAALPVPQHGPGEHIELRRAAIA